MWIHLTGRRGRGTLRVASMDLLEKRMLLSAELSADGVLSVTGTDAADAFVLRRSTSSPSDLQVQEGATTLRIFRIDAVRSIQVNLGAGDDTLTIDNAAGLMATSGELPIAFDGGAGSDTLAVVGTSAALPDEVLTVGPDAAGGKLIMTAGAASQGVSFSGVELLSDTAAASSFTVRLNDQGNLVELTGGPDVGAAATIMLRALDVTPCPVHTPAPAAATSIAAASSVATDVSAATSTGDAADTLTQVSEGGKNKRHHRKKAHKRKHRKGAAVDPTTAAVTAQPASQELLIGRAYVPVRFANKQRVTIETGAGDDWVSVNAAAGAAGLQLVTVDAGSGTDHSAELARPAGVTWANAGVEQVGAVRDFVAVTECSDVAPTPAPQPPPVPQSPPPVPSGDGHDDDDEREDGEGRGRDDHDDDKGRDDKQKDDDKEKRRKGKEDHKKAKHKGEKGHHGKEKRGGRQRGVRD